MGRLRDWSTCPSRTHGGCLSVCHNYIQSAFNLLYVFQDHLRSGSLLVPFDTHAVIWFNMFVVDALRLLWIAVI